MFLNYETTLTVSKINYQSDLMKATFSLLTLGNCGL